LYHLGQSFDVENYTMTVKIGDKLPAVTLQIMGDSGPQAITTAELFDGKKVVLFALPGAFTPTCSAKHLPGFVQHADALSAKGVDRIICLSVNDVFVMNAWGKDQQVGDSVVMLADGNGDFTRALGLEMDGSGFGMGQRSQRYALVAEDGVITTLAIEQPREFKVSSAEAVLAAL
jgi:peroxiredoxin